MSRDFGFARFPLYGFVNIPPFPCHFWVVLSRLVAALHQKAPLSLPD
jgi:hypothetical protein